MKRMLYYYFHEQERIYTRFQRWDSYWTRIFRSLFCIRHCDEKCRMKLDRWLLHVTMQSCKCWWIRRYTSHPRKWIIFWNDPYDAHRKCTLHVNELLTITKALTRNKNSPSTMYRLCHHRWIVCIGNLKKRLFKSIIFLWSHGSFRTSMGNWNILWNHIRKYFTIHNRFSPVCSFIWNVPCDYHSTI